MHMRESWFNPDYQKLTSSPDRGAFPSLEESSPDDEFDKNPVTF